MSTTTMTSREFNQDLGKAKKAAKNGPLIVTDRGKPEHVLLSYEEFKKMSVKGKSLAEVLAMPEGPVKGGMLYADDAKCDAMCDNSRLTQSWLDRGYAILSVELRGFGSTAAIPWRYNRDFIVESHGPNLPDVFIALMLGRSFVGFRAFDLLQSARALAAKLPAGTPLHLEARGQAVVPALHAAALEPGVFRTVRFSDGLQDWRHICQSVVADGAQLQFENVVQGALKAYDLPDLYRLVEERAAKPDAQPE